jgi:hypothetical protein
MYSIFIGNSSDDHPSVMTRHIFMPAHFSALYFSARSARTAGVLETTFAEMTSTNLPPDYAVQHEHTGVTIDTMSDEAARSPPHKRQRILSKV